MRNKICVFKKKYEMGVAIDTRLNKLFQDEDFHLESPLITPTNNLYIGVLSYINVIRLLTVIIEIESSFYYIFVLNIIFALMSIYSILVLESTILIIFFVILYLITTELIFFCIYNLIIRYIVTKIKIISNGYYLSGILLLIIFLLAIIGIILLLYPSYLFITIIIFLVCVNLFTFTTSIFLYTHFQVIYNS